MIQINNKSRYSDIRAYFMDHINNNSLPKTLQSECKYYRDVPKTVKLFINQIDIELEKINGDPKGSDLSAVAVAAKGNLITLHKDLQDISKWDAPLMNIDEYLKQRNKIIKDD